jgi:hypothetical protein
MVSVSDVAVSGCWVQPLKTVTLPKSSEFSNTSRLILRLVVLFASAGDPLAGVTLGGVALLGAPFAGVAARAERDQDKTAQQNAKVGPLCSMWKSLSRFWSCRWIKRRHAPVLLILSQYGIYGIFCLEVSI